MKKSLDAASDGLLRNGRNKRARSGLNMSRIQVNVRVFCYQLIAVIANTGIFVQNLMNYQR